MKETNENMYDSTKSLFFHVGLSKTGSTYLQNKFFHHLKGIKYIHTSKYKRYNKIIRESQEDKLLFSREFDRQFETEMLKIAQHYPSAKIIIVLRSTEHWIASQYRRYVKNGGYASFENFIDINTDTGIWKIKDANFYPHLLFIEEHFIHKPLLLFYDELKQNPYNFFNKIADYTGTSFEDKSISLTSKHKSYSDKQLLFVRNITEKLKISDHYKFNDHKLSWFKYRKRWLVLHLALYLAKILPLNYKSELISVNSLNRYKEFFKEDWNKCLEYSNK